jgi:mRNA-degrading endonuclease YafQ of YafQ-DinJ toxin-antitoxin module
LSLPADYPRAVGFVKGELKDHWAFSVDDDLRVVFRWEGEAAFLVNLGSHDEVY